MSKRTCGCGTWCGRQRQRQGWGGSSISRGRRRRVVEKRNFISQITTYGKYSCSYFPNRNTSNNLNKAIIAIHKGQIRSTLEKPIYVVKSGCSNLSHSKFASRIPGGSLISESRKQSPLCLSEPIDVRCILSVEINWKHPTISNAKNWGIRVPNHTIVVPSDVLLLVRTNLYNLSSRVIDTAPAFLHRPVPPAKGDGVHFVGFLSGGEIVKPVIDLGVGGDGGK